MAEGAHHQIHGHVSPGFEPVAAAFQANFDEHGDIGAGCAIFVAGECVVDLVGGTAADGSAYSADTLQVVFSATKGATALCAHLLAQRGELDLDAPVSRYWPEFAAHDKGDVPVSWLLCHKSGLIDVDGPMSYAEALEWDPVVSALAASAPVWEPGTKHGYHAVTYGWLVGEIVRRVSGRSLGTFFAEEVAGPLGADFHIGLADADHARVSKLIPAAAPTFGTDGDGTDSPPGGLIDMLDRLLGPGNLAGKALSAPAGAFADPGIWNDPAMWRAEIGSANGMCTAKGLATVYSSMVAETNGLRTLTAESVERARAVQTDGGDAVLIIPIPFGLGFMRDSMFSPLGFEGAFGHYGAGGSVGFAVPEHELSFGYATNTMQLGIAGDPRSKGLIDAAVTSIGS